MYVREYIAEQQKVKFDKTIIRVQIPGKLVLQLSFLPSETIDDLLKHIISLYSGNRVTYASFYLSMPPSKKIQSSEFGCTFSNLNLVPAATLKLVSVESMELRPEIEAMKIPAQSLSTSIPKPLKSNPASLEGIPSTVVHLLAGSQISSSAKPEATDSAHLDSKEEDLEVCFWLFYLLI